jgi:predicted transcriptional regulator
MKNVNLTIRLEPELAKALEKMSRKTRMSRSDIVRNALQEFGRMKNVGEDLTRRQRRIAKFEAVRQKLMPYAEAQGVLIDEDVFAIIS